MNLHNRYTFGLSQVPSEPPFMRVHSLSSNLPPVDKDNPRIASVTLTIINSTTVECAGLMVVGIFLSCSAEVSCNGNRVVGKREEREKPAAVSGSASTVFSAAQDHSGKDIAVRCRRVRDGLRPR